MKSAVEIDYIAISAMMEFLLRRCSMSSVCSNFNQHSMHFNFAFRHIDMLHLILENMRCNENRFVKVFTENSISSSRC